MIKKIMKSLLAVILVFSSLFVTTACGKDDGDDGLAGKVISIEFRDDIKWDSVTIFESSYLEHGNSPYSLRLKFSELVNETEHFNGIEFVKLVTGDNTITTVAQAEAALKTKFKNHVLEQAPKLVFNNDETKVGILKHSDPDNMTPTKAYDVVIENDEYKLMNENSECVGSFKILNDNELFLVQQGEGTIFSPSGAIDISNLDMPITLETEDGSASKELNLNAFIEGENGCLDAILYFGFTMVAGPEYIYKISK